MTLSSVTNDTARLGLGWYIASMYHEVSHPPGTPPERGRDRAKPDGCARPVLRSSCRTVGLVMMTLVTLACSERSRSLRTTSEAWWRGGQPDEPPEMVNDALPFQYPVAQYLRRIQGNVTLRLFVDAEGAVVPDSTRIEQSSGVAALDSAALAGSARLRFRAARRGGTDIPVALLFPVHFRHPEGATVKVDSL